MSGGSRGAFEMESSTSDCDVASESEITGATEKDGVFKSLRPLKLNATLSSLGAWRF